MMDEKITEGLNEAIMSQFQNLRDSLPGSEEETAAVENITKLYRLGIDEVKVDCDFDEKCFRREMDKAHQKQEEELKEKEAKDEKRNRWFQIGLSGGMFLLEYLATWTWHKRYLRFEETGTFSSRAAQKVDGLSKSFKIWKRK